MDNKCLPTGPVSTPEPVSKYHTSSSTKLTPVSCNIKPSAEFNIDKTPTNLLPDPFGKVPDSDKTPTNIDEETKHLGTKVKLQTAAHPSSDSGLKVAHVSDVGRTMGSNGNIPGSKSPDYGHQDKPSECAAKVRAEYNFVYIVFAHCYDCLTNFF
jgi:hypothetical protein